MMRIFVALLCAAILAGCSMVRVGYTQFDSIAVWSADGLFDLNDDQKREFRTRFARFHEWHRYEQLPDYAQYLGELRVRVERGFTREDALWAADGLRARYRTLMTYASDDAADLLMTITPEQLEHLRKRWERINRNFVRDFHLDASDAEQRRAEGRRTLSRVRDWVGHLDDAQEKQILAWGAALPLVHGVRHQERMRRQREFLDIMSQRNDPARFAARLRSFLLNWQEGRTPEYERIYKDWTERQADLYASVSRILLPHQRRAVADRLQGYINDFTYLARRPGPRAAAAQ